MSAPVSHRLFFALWPDPDMRASLARLAQQHARQNGRAVRSENLHITLVFVGTVTSAQCRCMAAAAATVRASPFVVTLNRLGYWPRPRVLWAGADTVPSALTELVATLNTALTPCGYQPDVRPYRAHVSLARKAQQAPETEQMPALTWSAYDFCLVESTLGEQSSAYRVIGRWPLRGSD